MGCAAGRAASGGARAREAVCQGHHPAPAGAEAVRGARREMMRHDDIDAIGTSGFACGSAMNRTLRHRSAKHPTIDAMGGLGPGGAGLGAGVRGALVHAHAGET
eukprot:523720-Rhodomonas_salina.2